MPSLEVNHRSSVKYKFNKDKTIDERLKRISKGPAQLKLKVEDAKKFVEVKTREYVFMPNMAQKNPRTCFIDDIKKYEKNRPGPHHYKEVLTSFNRTTLDPMRLIKQ